MAEFVTKVASWRRELTIPQADWLSASRLQLRELIAGLQTIERDGDGR